jgi:hypothetical protein
MRPTALSAAFVLALAVCFCSAADDPEPDPIKAKLDQDKEAYRTAAAKARARMLEAFDAEQKRIPADKVLKAAEKLDQLDQLAKERKVFESDGTLPKAKGLKKAVDAYLKEMKPALDACDKAFERAASEYVSAGRNEDARAVLAAKPKFLKDGTLTAAAGKREQWTPLFNGTNLDGWEVEIGNARQWRVDAGSGELVGNSPEGYKSSTYLLTRKDYSDYVLSLEFKFGPNGKSAGVCPRCRPGEKVPELNGQWISAHPLIKLIEGVQQRKKLNVDEQTGTTHWLKDAGMFTAPQNKAILKDGWNTMTVTMTGQRCVVNVNGTVVTDISLAKRDPKDPFVPGLAHKEGRIGLQAHVGEIRFRNIRVQQSGK